MHQYCSAFPGHSHIIMAAFPSLSRWYRLTNNFTGMGISLDVVNDAGTASDGTLQMAHSGDFSGQHWRFVSYPTDSSPTYAISTMFLGPNKRLDVFANDATYPHLADAGNYAGQIWTVISWGDGTYQLTNSYSGLGLHLDVYGVTNEPSMDGGDHPGQHWTLTPISDIADANSTVSTQQTTSTASTVSGSSAAAHATQSAAQQHGSLNVGAVVGSAVGGTIGGVLILVGIFWLLWSQCFRKTGPRKGDQNPQAQANPTSSFSFNSPSLPTSRTDAPAVASQGAYQQGPSLPIGQVYYNQHPANPQPLPSQPISAFGGDSLVAERSVASDEISYSTSLPSNTLPAYSPPGSGTEARRSEKSGRRFY